MNLKVCNTRNNYDDSIMVSYVTTNSKTTEHECCLYVSDILTDTIYQYIVDNKVDN